MAGISNVVVEVAAKRNLHSGLDVSYFDLDLSFTKYYFIVYYYIYWHRSLENYRYKDLQTL